MTDDQTTTTGTPEQDGGDAVEQSPTAGTPAKDGRDAESGGDQDWKALALEYKEKVEAYNALMKQKAQEGSAAKPDPRESKPKPSRAAAEEWRQKGDGVAAYAIETTDELKERLDQMEWANYLNNQLLDIPKEMHAAVKKEYASGRHLDYSASLEAVQGREYAERLRKMEEELRLLKRGPDPDVLNAPPTGGREVTARERNSKAMTEAQFDSQQDRIRREQGELAALRWAQDNAKHVE